MGRERWAEVGAGGCTQDVCRVAEWSRESSRAACVFTTGGCVPRSLAHSPACMHAQAPLLPLSIFAADARCRSLVPFVGEAISLSPPFVCSSTDARSLALSLYLSLSRSLAAAPHTHDSGGETRRSLSLLSPHTAIPAPPDQERRLQDVRLRHKWPYFCTGTPA